MTSMPRRGRGEHDDARPVGPGLEPRKIGLALGAAAMLVVATHDPLTVRQMASTARTLNPDIEVVLCMHSEDESSMLRKDGVGTVFFGEEELAKGMIGHVLARFAAHQSSPGATAASA